MANHIAIQIASLIVMYVGFQIVPLMIAMRIQIQIAVQNAKQTCTS